MTDYIKFRLSLGQQAPPGSTGVGLPDNWIAWAGNAADFPPEIEHVTATAEDIAEYQYIVSRPDIESNAKALLKLSVFEGRTYQQVDDYIETNVTSLATAKDVLKILAKAILAILKHSDLTR